MSELQIWGVMTAAGVGALILSIRGWSRSAHMQMTERLLLSSAPIILTLIAGAFMWRLLQSPAWSYNGTRLAPSFALKMGHRLYYLPGEGPALSTVYGPMTALIYLPTTLARTPNWAVLIGSAITMFICVTPLLLLTKGVSGRSTTGLGRVVAFIMALLLIQYSEPLRYSCINVHADGPSLAFGGMACVFLLRGDGRWLSMLAAAACAVLSVWSKQIAVPIFLGLTLFVYLGDGREKLFRFMLCCAICSVAMSVMFFAAFGPQEVWFNLVTTQGNITASSADLARGYIQSARALLGHGALVIIAVLMTVIHALMSGDLRRDNVRRWINANPWTLPVLLGISSAPIAILARIKMGGDVNSFSFALYYLTAGTAMIVAGLFPVQASRRHASTSVALVFSTIVLLTGIIGPTVLGIPQAVRALSNTEQQVAYDYIRRNPGKGFFLWFPLAHMLGEDRVYHTAWGLAEREGAGYRLTNKQIQAFVPPRMEFVAYGNEGPELGSVDLIKYTPEYVLPTKLEELRDWAILTKR